MSKDARTALVKVAKEAAEKAKVGIRRCRQKGISDARKRKDEVSEDDIKKTEKQVLYWETRVFHINISSLAWLSRQQNCI